MATTKNKDTENSSLVWEEPPVKRGGRAISARQKEIAEALQSKPGDWAKVASAQLNDGLASSIRRGTGASFRDGVYEARSVKIGEKSYDIYARYMGPLE